jgi:hypothetical protein
MADVELWLTRDAALERLRRFLKLSVGAAEAAFDEAMLSGTIRSRAFAILLSEANMERLVFEDRLEPEAWKRGDPRSINGEVSSDDLEFWVAQQLALSPGVAKPPEAAALLPDTGEAHDVTTPSGVQTNRQAALKAKCIAWIRTLPEQPLRRKPDVKVDALAAISGLSGRQFDAAWDEAAPASWKVPGPKSAK